MADYCGAISLSQPHTSDDDSSEHSPRSAPTLSASGGGGGSSKSKTPCNSIITLDHHQQHHHHLAPSSSENNVRKPRGRPPGSKNKPKPPVVITRDSDSAMKPVILEISAGSDIIDTILCFARRNHVGVTIISATGSVSNVTLRHPVSHAPAVLSLLGPFGLLSLSGSFIASRTLSSSDKTPKSSSSSTSPSPCSLSSPLSYSFGITLAGAQGQVFGGIVGGKVMAATQVIVVAATFVSHAFHRLPCEGDNEDHRQETNPGIHGNVGGGSAAGAIESCTSTGMSMSAYGVASPIPLNCQMSPDVMPWGPSSRPY